MASESRVVAVWQVLSSLQTGSRISRAERQRDVNVSSKRILAVSPGMSAARVLKYVRLSMYLWIASLLVHQRTSKGINTDVPPAATRRPV